MSGLLKTQNRKVMKRTSFLILLLAVWMPLMQAENTFPFAIFEKMQQTVEGNIIVSPASLEQAIGMAANGAQGVSLNELTALTDDNSLAALNQRNQQMAELLNQHRNDSVSYMRVANSVWHLPELALQQPFRDSVVARYNARIDTANFATQQGIDSVNAWVCNNTDSLITEIMNTPDPSLVVMLINATLFHGAWDWSLNPYMVGKQPFLNADGSGTNVDMVQLHNENWTTTVYLDEELVAAEAGFIGQDYDSHYRVLFILPRDYENMVALTAERWHNLLEHKQQQYVNILVPKFDVSCNEEMLPRLKEMGAFVANDFSGITSKAFVQSIIHSTRMTLDEEGMSAAAVTALMCAMGMPEPKQFVDFIINRPFYVAIMAEGSDEPVFLAKIKQLAGDACAAPMAEHITLGLENLQGATRATKYIRNGQLFLETTSGTYSATGQQLK